MRPLLFFLAISWFLPPLVYSTETVEVRLVRQIPLDAGNIRDIDLLVGPDGRIWTINMEYGTISAWNEHGEITGKFNARSRQDPPLRRFIGFTWSPSGEIAVGNLYDRSIDFYSTEGDMTQSLPTEDFSCFKLYFVDSGDLIIHRIPHDGLSARQELAVLEPSFRVKTIIVSHPLAQSGARLEPFAPTLRWIATQSGKIYCARFSGYRIEIYDVDGVLLNEISQEHDPVEITQDEKDGFLAMMPPMYEVKFPVHHPAIMDMTVDERGRLYVRTRKKGPAPYRFPIDIFDEYGGRIGYFFIEGKPLFWDNGNLYAITNGPIGDLILNVYRLD
ncbi:MAG: hypothetical protein SCM96_08485 [Acidobacteriota bacterium]|nr:hypothetical protein [Acidobacteriota bacterium]